MRTKLYVAAAKVNTQPTRSNPRCRSWRSIPSVFIHPKTSSIRFRFLWLISYPGCRVVRWSSRLLRRPWFWATCGVTPMHRSSSTNSRWSYPLSAPNVTRPQPGNCSAISSPASLRRTVGRGHLCVHHQSAPILRHQMPVVAQFRFLSWSLAGQHGLRIGGGTVCLISAFLSAIVDRGVILVPPCRRWFRLLVVILAHRIDWPEAFVRRPSFQQCSIHREVFVTEQLPGPCFSQNPLKERFGDVSFQHALPVLGKRAGIPHRVIHAQPHKPAEQQVVIQLLHQQPLASH